MFLRQEFAAYTRRLGTPLPPSPPAPSFPISTHFVLDTLQGLLFAENTRIEDDFPLTYRAFRGCDDMFKTFVVLHTHDWLLVSCYHIF